MREQTVTEKIFQFIENKFFSEKKNLLDEVSEVLNLQRSSIYKKYKGETSISLEEAAILCKHFRISMDDILGLLDDKIYFDFAALYGSVSNEDEFLNPIKSDLEKLYRLDPVIYYATKELPLFYHCFSYRLAAFKFNVFFNFVWKKDDQQLIPFDFNEYENNSKLKESVAKILELYSSLNSVEIWNTSVLDNTLNQIKYFLESGLLKNPNEAIMLCDEVDSLINVIEQCILSKDKSALRKDHKYVGSLEFYNNEIAHTNNVIFVKSKTRDAVYCTYDNPNFMRSISPQLCDYTDKWFKKLLNNSVNVTGGNMKDQKYFINRIREKLNRTRTSVQASLQELE